MTGDSGNAPSDCRYNASPEDLEEPMKNFKIEEDEEDEKDDADGRPNPYPQRPGEPDCKYYLRTGFCSYGSKCKYNHPTSTEQETKNSDKLPQRVDRPDCQFFLKTGFCKYDPTCKYHHPKDKHAIQIPPLNSFGLPLRKDMESCSHFLKTGSCKFGIACKYDHPQLNNIGAMFPGPGLSVYGYAGYSATTGGPHLASGYSAWVTSWNPYGTSSYMEGFPAYSSHALPINQTTMPIQQGWCTYLAPSTVTVSSMSSLGNNHAKPGSTDGIFPERPDEPDCQYYLKTGTCKYGSFCKYNHPKGATQVADCIIGPYGLPLRPDSPKCKHYATYGICKYGATCKFDHPIMAMYTLPGASEPYPFRDGGEITWDAPNNSSFKVLKGLDHLNASTDANGEQDLNNNEHDGQSSALTSPNHPAPNSDSSGNQSDEG